MKRTLLTLAAAAAAFPLFAAPGDEHLRQYAEGVPGDAAVEAASKLNVKVPVFAREWHIWTGVPYGDRPTGTPRRHMKREKKIGP